MLMNYELIIFVIVDNFDNLTLKRIETAASEARLRQKKRIYANTVIYS